MRLRLPTSQGSECSSASFSMWRAQSTLSMLKAAGMCTALMTLDPRQRKHPALRYAEERDVNMDITFACEKCGQQVVIDEAGAGIEVQCPRCGQPLVVPSQEPRQREPVATGRCSYCGETIRAGAKVCRFCGRPLTESAPASPVPDPIAARPRRGFIETIKIGIGILLLLAIIAVLVVLHTSWWKQHRVVSQAREGLVAALGGHQDTVSECDQIASDWARQGTLTKVQVYQIATTMAADKNKLFRKRVADFMLYGSPSPEELLKEENEALGPVKFGDELQWRCRSESNKRRGLPPPPKPKWLVPPPPTGVDSG